MSEKLVRRCFGDIWPHHTRAFNSLLIDCRKAVDGDLDKVLILGIIGERTLPAQRARGINYDDFLTGRRRDSPMQRINVQSISDCSGIPRETVRRKVAQLMDHGWIDRDPSGSLFIRPEAAEALKPVTEHSLEYLASIAQLLMRLATSTRS